MTESATFIVNDVDAPSLRDAVSRIASIGYCEKHICDRLGLSDITELMWRALPIYRDERLAARDALDLAIDLFLLQGAITIDELNLLMDKADQDIFIRSGLLFVDEKCLARASLFPVGRNLIFSDHTSPGFPHPGCVDVPHDQVMYVGTDSRWLAHATVRRPAGKTLDLCTGSGVHALLAASHSQRVVAVDINPRAARCTRFNAQVSGAANIEIAVGDLFEPVCGERFDLITANPPFVPSPVDAIGFRDGGQSGEDVQRRIVAGLPEHLAPGGIAQIVTELGERENEPLSDRLREWLNGAPMDILIHRLCVHTAASYAIGHAKGYDTYAVFFDSVSDWAGNLRAQGYTQIASVLLAFQWSDPASGSPWTRIEELYPPRSEAGKEIEEVFLTERMVRRPDFCRILEHSRIRRAGPIGLMEACVLGSGLRADTQAQLLGRAFPILKYLNPIELEVLTLMEEPLEFSELLALTQDRGIRSEDVYTSVGSLIRSGFILPTPVEL